jgi:hypothetical protein
MNREQQAIYDGLCAEIWEHYKAGERRKAYSLALTVVDFLQDIGAAEGARVWNERAIDWLADPVSC